MATPSCSPPKATCGASVSTAVSRSGSRPHPAEESRAAISPDGKTIAFSAAYEGPTEVYTVPIDGGVPVRQTFEGGNALVAGWTPSGDVLYTTRRFSTLPNTQLARVNPSTGAQSVVPLAQASDGSYDPSGKTLYSRGLRFRAAIPSGTKAAPRKTSGAYADGDKEAIELTADYKGTSKNPDAVERPAVFPQRP